MKGPPAPNLVREQFLPNKKEVSRRCQLQTGREKEGDCHHCCCTVFSLSLCCLQCCLGQEEEEDVVSDERASPVRGQFQSEYMMKFGNDHLRNAALNY